MKVKNRALIFGRFAPEKRKFFLDLHQQILGANIRRVSIQNTPGFRFNVLICAICKEFYWLTDVYSNLDYCPRCASNVATLRRINANCV
jgi:hypothetical protein